MFTDIIKAMEFLKKSSKVLLVFLVASALLVIVGELLLA
jgi:hypothetical protein